MVGTLRFLGNTEMIKCPKCNGTGKVYAELPKKSADHPDVEDCPTCEGLGYVGAFSKEDWDKLFKKGGK